MSQDHKIAQIANSVEDFFASQNVILTMGGEPTFIVPQPDTPEWNITAMGPERLGYARRMTAHLITDQPHVYPFR